MKQAKIISVFMCLLLVLNGCADTNQEVSTNAEKYPYDKSAWDANIGDGTTMLDFIQLMASDDIDMEQFVDSPYGEFALKINYTLYEAIDWDDPYGFNIDAWAERGITKEIHDSDDEDRVWMSFVPGDYDDSKAYPLLFVFGGHDCPIYWVENIGYSDLAYERQYIVVVPYASDGDIALEEFDRILAYMNDNYSIDGSKVYCAGFSKGGWATAHIALARSETLAAVAICGMDASVDLAEDSADGMVLPGVTDEEFAATAKSVPVMFWAGQYDFDHVYPYDKEKKIHGLNNWLTLNGCSNLQDLNKSLELADSSSTAHEKNMGLSFDEEEDQEIDGSIWHIGSYLNGEGQPTVVCIEALGALHDPAPSMARVVMDFLDQYQIVDGASVYLGKK